MEDRLDTVLVGEIMIPLDDYPHIYEWNTLRQAIEEMEKCGLDVRGRQSLPRMLLIFNKEEKLTGLLRRRDILRGIEPEFLVSKPLAYRKKLFDIEVDPNLSELSFDRLIKGMRERAERPVSDVMRPVNVTISHNEHIMKAIYEMVDGNMSLLPVLEDGRVVGVLRSVDIFQEVSRFLLQSD